MNLPPRPAVVPVSHAGGLDTQCGGMVIIAIYMDHYSYGMNGDAAALAFHIKCIVVLFFDGCHQLQCRKMAIYILTVLLIDGYALVYDGQNETVKSSFSTATYYFPYFHPPGHLPVPLSTENDGHKLIGTS